MSERQLRDYLLDMVESASRIISYTESLSEAEFHNDQKTQDAVIRNLEILGEAAKYIPDDFRSQHPNIPWASMAGMRDRLIHQYFGVNLDILWDIIQMEMPSVLDGLRSILSD